MTHEGLSSAGWWYVVARAERSATNYYPPHPVVQSNPTAGFSPNLTNPSSTARTSPQPRVMLSRMIRQRLAASLRTRRSPAPSCQRRWISPAPRPGDGPLMSRRADRELPGKKEGELLPLYSPGVLADGAHILGRMHEYIATKG